MLALVSTGPGGCCVNTEQQIRFTIPVKEMKRSCPSSANEHLHSYRSVRCYHDDHGPIFVRSLVSSTRPFSTAFGPRWNYAASTVLFLAYCFSAD